MKRCVYAHSRFFAITPRHSSTEERMGDITEEAYQIDARFLIGDGNTHDGDYRLQYSGNYVLHRSWWKRRSHSNKS